MGMILTRKIIESNQGTISFHLDDDTHLELIIKLPIITAKPDTKMEGLSDTPRFPKTLTFDDHDL